MNIRITDEAMTSDTTPRSTRADGDGWAVNRHGKACPGRGTGLPCRVCEFT
jgi:hypothetical protein